MKTYGMVLSGCLFAITACGESGGVPAGAMTPTAAAGGTGAAGAAASAGTSGSNGTAGSTSAGSGGKPSGGSGGAGGGPAPVTAVAKIAALASAPSGAAGSSGSGGSSGSAGAGGAAAGGGISGTATFTKVNILIDIDGCMDGKNYPVHIHEGMSCDNAMTQGGHWGAMTAAAGSGGSSGGSSGGAGHSAGSGGSSAGSGGAAGGMMLMLRGEGIPDIMCKGSSGTTSVTRSTPDARIAWTIGGDPTTDVVGHVVVVHNAAGDRVACGKIVMQ
jgi:hypothetical protein